MNCMPRYPVDYAYAQGMLIMHKPWKKTQYAGTYPQQQTATIDTFLRMIDRKEVPSSVTFQYLTAMKYARQKKIEILVMEGVNNPDIDEENLDLGRSPYRLVHKKKTKDEISKQNIRQRVCIIQNLEYVFFNILTLVPTDFL